MKFRILSALLRSKWAIDERFAIAHGGIVAGLLNGMEFQPVDKPSEAPISIPFYISEDCEESETSNQHPYLRVYGKVNYCPTGQWVHDNAHGFSCNLKYRTYAWKLM